MKKKTVGYLLLSIIFLFGFAAAGNAITIDSLKITANPDKPYTWDTATPGENPWDMVVVEANWGSGLIDFVELPDDLSNVNNTGEFWLLFTDSGLDLRDNDPPTDLFPEEGLSYTLYVNDVAEIVFDLYIPEDMSSPVFNVTSPSATYELWFFDIVEEDSQFDLARQKDGNSDDVVYALFAKVPEPATMLLLGLGLIGLAGVSRKKFKK